MKKIIVSTPSSLWKIAADTFTINEQGLNIRRAGEIKAHFPHGQFLSVLVSGDWPKINTVDGEKEVVVGPDEN